MVKECYIGYCKDNNIVKRSSSGGAFSALTDKKIDEGYIIYGCVLNDDLNAKHIRANNKSDRDKMRGSKYIASNISNSYKLIEEDIKNNNNVVFSGTPCQVAGLYSYLEYKKIPLENVYTIEIICHGVGSNQFFRDYINNLEKKFESKAISCNFRSKSKPGKLQDMTVYFENGRKFHSSTTNYDWFYSAYLKNLILRPSCYECKFACEDRKADVSIADAWGENDKISNSLILCNTEKGCKWVDSVKDSMTLRETSLKKFYIPNMHKPSEKPENYNEFMDIYINKGYLEAQTYIGNNTLKTKIKVILANIIDFLNLSNIIKKLKRGNK